MNIFFFESYDYHMVDTWLNQAPNYKVNIYFHDGIYLPILIFSLANYLNLENIIWRKEKSDIYIMYENKNDKYFKKNLRY